MSTSKSPFFSDQDSDLINRSIPELASMLRLEFRQSEYDKIEKALLAREESLKKDMRILKKKNLELERLRVEEATNSNSKGVLDEDKMVIFDLRGKLCRSETERLKLEGELEPLQSRIELLENQVMELFNRSGDGDANVRHKNFQKLFDTLMARNGNRNVQLSEDREAEIVRQRVDYLALEESHKKLIEEKALVENEVKDCKGEIDMLKRERDIANARHEECRAELEDMEKKRIASNERCKKLLEENRKKMENDSVLHEGYGSESVKGMLKRERDIKNARNEASRAKLEGMEEKQVASNERFKKLLEENRKEMGNDSVLHGGYGYESVKGSRNGLDSAGTSKCSSTNIIQISDDSSDDDNAPGEDTEQNTIPITEMKQRGNQNNPSSLHQMISGQSKLELSEAVKSVLAKTSDESDDSSGFYSSSSDSDDTSFPHLFKKPKLPESSQS